MQKRNKKIQSVEVAEVFDTDPPLIREKLLAIRRFIFDTAAEIEGIGELEETLKWGEPAYLTAQSKSGSTVRIDWKESGTDEYAVYFNGKTTLVKTFKAIYGDLFQ